MESNQLGVTWKFIVFASSVSAVYNAEVIL